VRGEQSKNEALTYTRSKLTGTSPLSHFGTLT
jgi:hypothetical protein